MTTSISFMERKARPKRHDATPPQFGIGQAVRMKSFPGAPSEAAKVFRISGMAPPSGNFRQYRIRADGEAYERMTTEDHLEVVVDTPATSNESLIERTFGNG